MEQRTNLSGVPVLFSIAPGFSISSSSVECASENENAKDYYDDRPEDVPKVTDVSACLQEQTEPYKYYYYAEDKTRNGAAIG